jgi:hypothetical protein
MNGYKKRKVYQDHNLSQVFQAYQVNHETEFVREFFGAEQVQSILESCGLPSPDEVDLDPEFTVKVGKSSKRADLVFEGPDDTLYYFEVMSQLNGGKWDDDHHQQFYLKSTRLSQLYETVYSFAIAFKEFDSEYLEEFAQVPNWYAIHLRFCNEGYWADSYAVQQKKEKTAIKNQEKEETSSKLVEVARKFGWVIRRSSLQFNNYLYIGKPYAGSYKGLEWAISSKEGRLGIRLHSSLYSQEPFKTILQDAERFQELIKEIVPEIEFLPPGKAGRGKDATYYFAYDKNDYSEENLEKLKRITLAFAKVLGIEQLF